MKDDAFNYFLVAQFFDIFFGVQHLVLILYLEIIITLHKFFISNKGKLIISYLIEVTELLPINQIYFFVRVASLAPREIFSAKSIRVADNFLFFNWRVGLAGQIENFYQVRPIPNNKL